MNKRNRRILTFGLAVMLLFAALLPFPYTKESTGDNILAEALADEVSDEAAMETDAEEPPAENDSKAEVSADDAALKTDDAAPENDLENQNTVLEDAEPEMEPVLATPSNVEAPAEATKSEGSATPFSLNISDTPAFRQAIKRDLSGFAPEATYQGGGISFTGLFSECWDLAVQSKTGTITLIADVTAHAYDPSVYNGNSYTENGVTKTGVSHAVTRFTGGLGTVSVASGMDVTIDLNGHAIDRNMDEADGTIDRAYTVEVFDGGSLTITDSAGGGRLTGGYGKSCICGSSYGSSVIVHAGGTFTLDNAEISGNTGDGAVKGEGSVILKGNAKIKDNTDAAGTQKNLYVSGNLDVNGEGLLGNAEIGLTASVERTGDAVYWPAGDPTLFTSDGGLGTHLEGDYIAVGEEVESPYEAEFLSHTGTKYTGTFAEMFARMKTEHTGTLKIMKNISVTGTYTWNVWGNATIDFNGHVVKATGTSSQNFLTLSSGASTGITLTDSTGRAKERTRRVEEAGSPSWDAASRMYKYYISYAEDGGTDTGMIMVTDEVTADFSRLGGLDVSGYNRAIRLETGSTVNIKGGAHRADNGFLHTTNGSAKVNMSGGYVYDCGDRNSSIISGGAFWLQNANAFSMTGGIIAGCELKQGGAIRGDTVGSFSITGGTITQCYGAYNGGALYLNTNTKNITINNALFCNNGAGERGGAVMLSSQPAVFKQTVFAGNKGVTGGAVQILSNNGSASFTDCILIGNQATIGGGFSQESGTSVTLSMKNTMATRNTGGGISFIKGTYKLGDGNTVTKNEGGNVSLGTGAVMLFDALSDSSKMEIGITTADKPAKGSDVPFVRGASAYDIAGMEEWFSSDESYYVKRDGDVLCLSVDNPNQAFNGVLMQFYAYLDRVDYDSEEGHKLNLINTTGGILPKNNVTPPTTHLNVDSNGNVVTDLKFTQIYADKNLDVGTIDIDAMNSFYRNNYEMYEVWTSKEGTLPGSVSRDEWNVVPYRKGMTLDMKDGTVVRIVAKQTDGTWNSDVIFYDYDIMDGGWYKSADDANAAVNQQLTSAQPEETEKTKLWVNTQHYGINSFDNYAGTGAKYAFGNGNMAVDHEAAVWNSPTGKININRYNRATNGVVGTFAGAAYGIPSHLDEEGRIVYSDGLDVPALFNRDMAVGKSIYTDYGFDFVRQGDTYTLSSVSGTELSNLEKFHNPGIYDGVQNPAIIWSNGFWPMDWAPSYGTDGHDVKFGSSVRDNNKQVLMAAKPDQRVALADAGLDHNSYFGFQLDIAFSMPQSYRGPMDYIFFGDDDIWVFLDGQLVCDIGGVHSAVGEYVNLWDYLEEDDTAEHKLSIFYTERGSSGSTCWMRFTLPNVMSQTKLPAVFSHSFDKTDGNGRPLTGVQFSLYKEESCTKPVAQAVSDSHGRVTFSGILDNSVYYLKETKALPGYTPDSGTYVISQDADGDWRMYRLGDKGRTTVTRIVNTAGNEMPETGRPDALYLGIFGFAMLLCSGLVYGLARKRRKKA